MCGASAVQQEVVQMCRRSCGILRLRPFQPPVHHRLRPAPLVAHRVHDSSYMRT
ncbi:BgTH12-07243 [Blumeria graminis f. sp. triticale]|uniref:BgTH12-07243 n=1 Tax=Blumeria graminis f. sp. triticale TaxID=1689686 RepID=A0A9W4GI67_BLUGR|nr:BgTH12-07243 [Blumeria graminis f. sp. triticale]